MVKYNILILGSGGREHALAWKISQSLLVNKLWVAPGNGGTHAVATNVVLDPMDFNRVADFCKNQKVDYLVVGPEAPLVAGIVDHIIGCEDISTQCIGPDAPGAQLEGSKAFAKQFMARYGIPTASYQQFGIETRQDGLDYITNHALPIVLKADGLAAGKGVIICTSHDQAVSEFEAMLDGKFGAASENIVVEEFLEGIEFSVFALTDGKFYKLLPIAKDYKRIGEGDTGLNTGGMGAISPVPFVDDILMQKVIDRIVEPTVLGIRKEEMNYHGFIFFGLISVKGEPYLIEYNCRMGDPETQVVLPRLNHDLVQLFDAMHSGRLSRPEVQFDPRIAAAVVCVSGGYPGKYEKGKRITLPNAGESMIFHAGTKRHDQSLETDGGRVLAVTSLSNKMEDAIGRSIAIVNEVEFEGKYFRKDIGFDL